ncbi:MAG: hypothetical protein IPJ00_11805 [Saprospirales bacterium]|nr:hypothetical protein [Saprospirales bacterium]
MRDTSSYQADSIRYWIGQVNTLPHQYVLVSQYLQEGDTIQAANTLDFIASNYALSISQQETHEEFEELAEWKKAIMQTGDWMAYAEENQTELEDLAGEGISRSAIQAQHYYNFVFGQSWYPLIEVPEGGGQSAGRIPLRRRIRMLLMVKTLPQVSPWR